MEDSDIARVICRCLEKEPRHRLPTGRDGGNDFRDLAQGGTRLPEHGSHNDYGVHVIWQ